MSDPGMSSSPLIQRATEIQRLKRRSRGHLVWAIGISAIIFALVFDLVTACPTYTIDIWTKAKYASIAVLSLLCLGCIWKYIGYLYAEPITGSYYQKKLLGFDDNDTSFIVEDEKPSKSAEDFIEPYTFNNNETLLWCSSFDDSLPSFTWDRSITPLQRSISPEKKNYTASSLEDEQSFESVYAKNDSDFIRSDEELRSFLDDVREKESEKSQTEYWRMENMGQSHSFWNYCHVAANLLRTSIYQPGPPLVPKSLKQLNDEPMPAIKLMDRNSDMIKEISSDKLSRYVTNLRMWISMTILQRLVREIDNIDESFKSRNAADMQIGKISLDRLRKIAENESFVRLYAPTLPLVVPFLELSTNQEYLVQRIKDLTKSSCILDYRWNSGATYFGVKWNEHLPTDAAIIFHLFCVYMDSQLKPLPQGGGRPFYSHYVIVGAEKRSAKDTIAAVQNKPRCAIHVTNPLQSKFNFIGNNEIHNSTYNRNNLFYTIIEFLIYMKSNHYGCLEGVNLGKSGINILCVIDD